MRQPPCSNFSGRALLSVQLHSCIAALSGWWPHQHRLVTASTGHSSTLYKHCPTVSPWIAWIERRTLLLCLLLTKIWIKLHETNWFYSAAAHLHLPFFSDSQWTALVRIHLITMRSLFTHPSTVHHNAVYAIHLSIPVPNHNTIILVYTNPPSVLPHSESLGLLAIFSGC